MNFKIGDQVIITNFIGALDGQKGIVEAARTFEIAQPFFSKDTSIQFKTNISVRAFDDQRIYIIPEQFLTKLNNPFELWCD